MQDDDELVVKREKRKGKGKAVDKRKAVEDNQSDEVKDEDVDDESDDNNSAKIDVTNFKNQPLSRTEMPKVKGLASDWDSLDKKIQQSWAGVRQVSVAMAESTEDEQGHKALEELDLTMRELIDISSEMNAHEQSLDEIYQKIAQGEQISDAVDRYQGMVQGKAREYTQKTSRQKYAKNEQYARFKENIYEVLHPDQAMPPITELIPREDGDDSEDEDDLEVGGATQVYKCPLTLTALVDPLTSTACGHSFSADAIRAYFKGSRAKKCPASGCHQAFQLTDCKPDKELARKVKIWVRRKQRHEEDIHDDAEEVIE
ncbi:hypothetical protein M378DRAFT_122007 [Amanita muscaria Koide BX008]|uniref:SP-RING-type domain-containing protein n=1 Tax=Amanita muscaria (strain Koide BX008) TaxID=946122 RepID=A0A0C2X148_AMAMK|nr:hypothetical protein M378DRAFT_122007 [Amanita muscaria Koide BX008]